LYKILTLVKALTTSFYCDKSQIVFYLFFYGFKSLKKTQNINVRCQRSHIAGEGLRKRTYYFYYFFISVLLCLILHARKTV